MPQAGQHATSEIERSIPQIPETVVDSISKNPKENHIPTQVHVIPVQEHRSEELIQLRVSRVQEQSCLVQALDAEGSFEVIAQQVNYHIGGNQRIIHHRYAFHPIITAYGYHVKTASYSCKVSLE